MFYLSALLTMLPLALSGYARLRRPEDSAGLWLFGVAVVSGWMAAGVREGLWPLLLVQLVIVLPPSAWWIRRRRGEQLSAPPRSPRSQQS